MHLDFLDFFVVTIDLSVVFFNLSLAVVGCEVFMITLRGISHSNLMDGNPTRVCDSKLGTYYP